MTYIKPQSSNFLFTVATAVLICTVVLMAVYLIIIYSRTVNFTNELQIKRAALKMTLTESAEIQNQIFQQVTDPFLRSKALELGLVEDKNPTYFELQKKWLFASQ